ncbi:hypothetical protein [Sporomusa aerivorans]|uniref:hypothetical protein n=1 Tax=Sporomusa aerivorans TaxID=204936 RepID=UPI003529EDD4
MMDNNIFNEIQALIFEARRKHGREPDYIILGRENLIKMKSHDDCIRNISVHPKDGLKVFGIEIAETSKEYELDVAYKA